MSWGVLHHSAALQLEAYFETRQISANRERKEVQHGAYEEILLSRPFSTKHGRQRCLEGSRIQCGSGKAPNTHVAQEKPSPVKVEAALEKQCAGQMPQVPMRPDGPPTSTSMMATCTVGALSMSVVELGWLAYYAHHASTAMLSVPRCTRHEDLVPIEEVVQNGKLWKCKRCYKTERRYALFRRRRRPSCRCAM